MPLRQAAAVRAGSSPQVSPAPSFSSRSPTKEATGSPSPPRSPPPSAADTQSILGILHPSLVSGTEAPTQDDFDAFASMPERSASSETASAQAEPVAFQEPALDAFDCRFFGRRPGSESAAVIIAPSAPADEGSINPDDQTPLQETKSAHTAPVGDENEEPAHAEPFGASRPEISPSSKGAGQSTSAGVAEPLGWQWDDRSIEGTAMAGTGPGSAATGPHPAATATPSAATADHALDRPLNISSTNGTEYSGSGYWKLPMQLVTDAELELGT